MCMCATRHAEELLRLCPVPWPPTATPLRRLLNTDAGTSGEAAAARALSGRRKPKETAEEPSAVAAAGKTYADVPPPPLPDAADDDDVDGIERL